MPFSDIWNRILLPARVSARTPPFVPPRYGEAGNYEDYGNYSYGGTNPAGSPEDWENEPSYHTGVPSPASPYPGPVEVNAAQAPIKADYQKGLGRRILGGIIEAASPLAGGFGVSPHIVADLGRDVATPGYNRAMDEWTFAQQRARMVSEEQEHRQRLEIEAEQNRQRARANDISEQWRMIEEQRRMDEDKARQENERQKRRASDIALAERQHWEQRPLEEKTYGQLQIPITPSREPGEFDIPTTPISQLPSAAQPVVGPEAVAVRKGWIPRSRFESIDTDKLVEGEIPGAQALEEIEAQAKRQPLNEFVRQGLLQNSRMLPPDMLSKVLDEKYRYSPAELASISSLYSRIVSPVTVGPGGVNYIPTGVGMQKRAENPNAPVPSAAEGTPRARNLLEQQADNAAGQLMSAHPEASLDDLNKFADTEVPPHLVFEVRERLRKLYTATKTDPAQKFIETWKAYKQQTAPQKPGN